MATRLAIVYDRLRWEEKQLYTGALGAGVEVTLVDAKTNGLALSDDLGKWRDEDVVLQRCISYYRGLYYTAILESMGVPVINKFGTSLVGGNKLLTTLKLVKAGVPTPHTYAAFSDESALNLMEDMGYPVVVKPIVGSWGRLIARIDDRDDAGLLIEARRLSPDPLQHIYYLQEYVDRPPRDIRAVVVGDDVVAAIYRYQPPGDWRTNVARGGRVEAARLAGEQREIILKAAEAVGGGVLGVDAMEARDGLLVHEVNNTVEFKGASQATGVDIASRIVEYAKAIGSR